MRFWSARIDVGPAYYVYSFEWGHYQPDGSGVTPAPWNYSIGAAHALDVPFFLSTLDQASGLSSLVFTEENSASRHQLGNTMVGYLQEFMAGDDPNREDLPSWDAWSNAEGAGKYLVLDAGFNDLQIAMRNEGVSRDTALAMIEDIADPVLRERVRAALLAFPITCALLAEVPSVCR